MATNKQTINKQLLTNELGIIHVDYQNGIIYRWNKKNNKVLETKPTVSKQHNLKDPNKNNYTHHIACIRGKTYSFSNLVYVWYVGEIPSGYLIDHINGDTNDNRPSNLRLYTQ